MALVTRVRVGKLRRRVQLQKAATTADDHNQKIETFATQKTRWASIEPLSGQEYFEAQRVSSAVTHRIVMRYVPNVTTDWEVRFGSRTFGIVAVLNVEERNVWLVLMCKEGT